MALGVASWRGLGVSFTDGMCAGCAVRFRRQWNLPAIPVALGPRVGLMQVAAALLLVTSLILAARPLDDVHTPPTMTGPPGTALVPTAPEDESMPALSVSYAPRRARATTQRRVPPPPRVASPAPATLPTPSVPDAVSIPDTATQPVLEVATAMEPLSASETPEEPRSTSARTFRFPTRTAFAALPHAGLTQQTP
jgi:hypothetical protein